MDFVNQAKKLGIGDTPLLRYDCECAANVFFKQESMNPGGSVKDRAALALILDAEEKGLLHSGGEIVEASSGNMGISLAYVGVRRGYRVTVVMPDNMSEERRELIRGLGGQLVLTDGAQAMRGAQLRADEIAKSRNALRLDQFSSLANAQAHYLSTGEEILSQLDKVDVFVAGVGTGGTLMGTARRIKEAFPACKVVAVEPSGSNVLSGGKAGRHAIQGIGAGFVPAIYDASLVDEVQCVTDEEALDEFFILSKKQGYCCGISSAANLAVCLRLAQQPCNEGKNVVTVFPDGDDRYLSLLKSVK